MTKVEFFSGIRVKLRGKYGKVVEGERKAIEPAKCVHGKSFLGPLVIFCWVAEGVRMEGKHSEVFAFNHRRNLLKLNVDENVNEVVASAIESRFAEK